jgi:hypothetical protein
VSIILIIAIIWGASALARASKEVKAERERERLRREQAARSAELARMTAEWKQRQAEAKIETQRLIALEREAMRQREVERKQAEWNARQEEINRKTEERLLRLEQKMEIAKRDEAHYSEEVTAITVDMKSVKAYVEYMHSRGLPCKGKEAELEKLNKKLYAAETKLIKARQARELCEKQMSA